MNGNMKKQIASDFADFDFVMKEQRKSKNEIE